MKSRYWLPVVVAVLVGAAVPGSSQVSGDGRSGATGGTGSVEEARGLLREASLAQQQSRGLKGEEREKALMAAVPLYQRILERFPDAHEQCAEAAFRTATIHRVLKDYDLALQWYERVLTYPRARVFCARALVETGHIYRRGKQYDRARRLYAEVREKFGDVRPHGAASLLWEGQCLAAEKRWEEARQTWWKVVSDYKEEVVKVIRAYDYIAGSFLHQSNEADARDVLGRCEEDFLAALDPESREYRRARQSFERMRTRKRLARLEDPGDGVELAEDGGEDGGEDKDEEGEGER